MKIHPTGTVTFLFTDIEGSTKLAQEYPDAMPQLLARHHEILNQSMQAHNGYVFQIIGDAFCTAFHSAGEALKAAFAAQRALVCEPWDPAPIKVRMGIHTGTAQLTEDGQYSGYTTLASTQRIMSAGHGGQVLLSGTTRELVRDSLPTYTELIDLGQKRLKDLLHPEHLYQLNISGLPNTFPPLKTLDVYPNNLPIQLNSFIGREKEIAEVNQELNEHRLVTLTGSGGTGKTRLSLQVAADLIEKFDNGIWLVELAPLTDPELIPQTILSALGVQEQPGRSPLEVLKEYLREKQMLILLDNCEHLVAACAKAADSLLTAAPKLKVLASSREALGVKGEVSYPVPSLSLPDIKHLPEIEQLSRYEAVRLFIDRALLVVPHFIVDKDNIPFIAQICCRLDGIPLAIELAAARVKMMSADQISKRLDDRFRLLTGGARTALPRQQTLRALIDWSYDHLSENERLLFRRLSVFAGGWTLEAAEKVCAGDKLESYDVLDLLTQLVNKSLVTVFEHSLSGETRYRMLETIRQYAREKLLETGGGEIVRQQHLAYFAALAGQAEPELYHSNQVFWLNRLEDEIDNLRIALEWARTADVLSGFQIASTPYRFWIMRGYARELSDWLRQLLDGYDKAEILYAQGLAIYSYCIFLQGIFPEAVRVADRSFQIARTLSDKRLEAFSLSLLGVENLLQGNVRDGAPLLEQGLALFRTQGDVYGQALALEWLAYNNSSKEQAMEYTRDSLALHRELGDLIGIAGALITLSRLAIWAGDLSSPIDWLEEALTISRQLADRATELGAVLTWGILEYWRGDYEKAIAHFEEANKMCEKLGDRYQNIWSHVRMAHVMLRQGDIHRARELFVTVIRQTQEANFAIALVYAVEGLASLYANQDQPERALRLFAWTDSTREKIGDQRPPVEKKSLANELAIVRSKLGDAEYSKLYAEGHVMTTEQVVELAMKDD